MLVNLFVNALDAMPAGGLLDVLLQAEGAAGIHLTVTDTGEGIPPEMSSQLFTPFASTKPTGSGLGLSISRRIIEDHGGSITGTNHTGGGARFTITLPAATREDHHANAPDH